MEEKNFRERIRDMAQGETQEECLKRLLVEDLRDVADGIESGKYKITEANLQRLAAKLIQIQEQLPTITQDYSILDEPEEEK